MVGTAIVLTGGDPVSPAVRDHLPDDGFVIAADSGVHLAPSLGLHVDVIVGDLDSAEPSAIEAAVRAGASVEAHPAEKDATDFELALDAAVARGARRVVVVGGAGGRIDHFLGNVALLVSERFAACELTAFMGDARIAVVRARGQRDVCGVPGSLVTLLAAGGWARGVTTSGLRYPLAGEDLPPTTSRGVSNELMETRASVALREGTLLVIQPFGGKR